MVALPSPPPEPQRAAVDPSASETFPREHLTALLGTVEARRERRERLSVLVIGMGLAMIAMGLHSQRLWGDMELVRMAAGSGERSAGILFPLAVALKQVAGITAEQACLILATLSYGLCLPATVALLRTIGFDHGLSLVSATTAVLGAAAWLGGTQPGDFAPGMLGATLLLRTLFQPRERVQSGYQWRAALLLTLAFLLRPENLLLFPATAWAVSRHRGRGRMRGPLAGVTLGLVLAVTLSALLAGQPGEGGLGTRLVDTLLAGRSPSADALLGWLVYLSAGFGIGLFGIYALLFGRRQPEETPAPPWIVPWCLVVLAPVVGGSVSAGPIGAYLAPAAAVGLADWLTRRERGNPLRRGAGLLLAQVALTLTVGILWSSADPLRQWRSNAQERLEPDDVVQVIDPRHRYVLEQRWGIETWEADPGLKTLDATLPSVHREALAAGRARLVLVQADIEVDGERRPLVRPGQVLHPRLDAWVLTEDDLVHVSAGQPYRGR